MNTEHTNQPRQAANAAFEQWWQRHGLEDPMDDEDRYYITASSWARRGYLAAMLAPQAEPVARIASAKHYMAVELLENFPNDVPNDTPLYLAQPVARDVLIKAINEAIHECRYYGYDAGGLFQGWPEGLAEKIADRYAAQPPAVAVAVPDGWRDAAATALQFIEANAEHDQLCEIFDLDDDGRHKGCTCGMEDAVKKLRAMLAAAPQAATEGCGACGDGCQGQGCRLDRESPPTCQTCNGHGMIGGLLPNGGGYDGEPCPDCTAPQATAEDSSVVQAGVAVPKAPTWYKRSDIVKALERMNYHTAIADELADWFLRHMQQAFNRGFYQAHGPAAATQLEELELWHLLERATGELTRRAAPHAWEQIAWRAGTEFIEQRRARLAAAQKGGAA